MDFMSRTTADFNHDTIKSFNRSSVRSLKKYDLAENTFLTLFAFRMEVRRDELNNSDVQSIANLQIESTKRKFPIYVLCKNYSKASYTLRFPSMSFP